MISIISDRPNEVTSFEFRKMISKQRAVAVAGTTVVGEGFGCGIREGDHLFENYLVNL